MHRRRSVSAILLAAAVLAATIPGTAVVAKPAPGPVKPPAWENSGANGATRPQTVTLVTGDRVTIAGAGKVAIQPGPQRSGITFATRTVEGHVHVVPSDAQSMLRSGQLDPRLFDVTLLVQSRYDDGRADLPLIVTHTGGGAGALGAKSRVATTGSKITRELPGVDGLAVKAQRNGVFWQQLTSGSGNARALGSGVSKVWLDAYRKPALDESVPQVRAPQAWEAGYTGTGVTVAVLDTGADVAHPDLVGRIAASANFTEGEEDDLDRVGHGTHVSSTIAGSGAASGGQFKGVAPGAKLAVGKVCVTFGCAESWILAGMQWAAADQHAKVVNMSLGGGDTPEVDPLEAAIETLTAQHGTLFVVAAGNAGGDETVGSPASADAALAVGAVDKQDRLAGFSSRGPRVGDAALKPEITAPGVDITAAISKDAEGFPPGEKYFTASGTSMATPHVAGAAAILAQRHPDWTPAQLKAGLMGAASPSQTIGVYAQGAGRLDVGRAVTQTVTTTPASVSFGRAAWPHNDDPTITRTISYHNYGTAPVTLSLAVNATGPGGTAAPAGMFSLSAGTVTVPAGGDASVTLTADTRVGTTDGYFGGQVTATGDGQVVQTPFAVDREVESYTLTVRVIDRAGQPADAYDVVAVRMDAFDVRFAYDEDGTVTMRLPKARYTILGIVFDFAVEPPSLTELVAPGVDLSRDMSLVLDARKAGPVDVRVPNPEAASRLVDASVVITVPDGLISFGVVAEQQESLFLGQVGRPGRVPGLLSTLTVAFADADEDGSFHNTPFSYHAVFAEQGRFFNGFSRRLAQRDFATLYQSFARQVPNGSGERILFGEVEGAGGAIAAVLTMDLPGRRVEYVHSSAGTRWSGMFFEVVPAEPFPTQMTVLFDPAATYQNGRTYRDSWNVGVHGPCFPETAYEFESVSRIGDLIHVSVPPSCDAAAHPGFVNFTTARTTLYRDGTKVGEAESDGFARFEVPAEPGRYRLEVELTLDAPFELGLRRLMAWEFDSAHVAGETPVRLPLSAVRLLPPLDGTNTAPAGTPYLIPIALNRQPGSSAGVNRALSLDVSYDDGRTWRAAPVIRLFGGGFAVVNHPAGAGFVSLRAKATDTGGNTSEYTTIRAYRIA